MKNKHLISVVLAVVVSILLLGKSFVTYSQEKISVDKMTVPMVTITDPGLIDFFMFEFFIAETLVTKLEIIDATSNGFGEDDLVKTYPSEAIYFPIPSDSAQQIMNSWKFKANFQIVTENRNPEQFEAIESQKAENGIFASIMRGINRNYDDESINIWFQRDDNGVTFEMWGYNIDSLDFSAPPPAVPDSITTYDMVHVFHSDTLIRADSTMFDLIYVYKTVVDTVYFGEGVTEEKNGVLRMTNDE